MFRLGFKFDKNTQIREHENGNCCFVITGTISAILFLYHLPRSSVEDGRSYSDRKRCLPT